MLVVLVVYLAFPRSPVPLLPLLVSLLRSSDLTIQMVFTYLHSDDFGEAAECWSLVEASDPEQRFERIVLSRSMLLDHLASSYIEGLQDVLSRMEDEGNSEGAAHR